MKIVNYKSAKVGWMIQYNERKLSNRSSARIGGNVSGSSETIERIFKHVAEARESANLKNRYIHMKISLSPTDKDVSSGTFRKVATEVLHGLGLDDNPYIVYRHYDTPHPHVHVVVSRIKFNGTLVRDSFDGMRLKRLERELAESFNLTQSFNRLLTPAGIRLPQKWEEQKMETTGVKSVRNYVQSAVFESIQDQPSLSLFVARLERRGVKIFHHETIRSRASYHGLSYTLDPTLLNFAFQNLNNINFTGIDQDDTDSLSGGEIKKIKHRYFGPIAGRIMKNQRGIREFCINKTSPDNNPKSFSFRASNLGPFFQYPSIVRMLSSVEEETLRAITVSNTGRKPPTAVNYKRDPIFKAEPQVNKLIYAAELKSVDGLKEAFSEIRSQNVLKKWLDYLPQNEQEFIDRHRVLIRDRELEEEKSEILQQDSFASLVTRFTALTGVSPNPNTLSAIKHIDSQDWADLNTHLSQAMKNGNRKDATHPAITYLGLDKTLNLLALDYINWYRHEDGLLLEEKAAPKRNAPVQMKQQASIGGAYDYEQLTSPAQSHTHEKAIKTEITTDKSYMQEHSSEQDKTSSQSQGLGGKPN